MKPQADVLAIITAALSGQPLVVGMLIGVAIGILGAKRKSRFLGMLSLFVFIGTFLVGVVLYAQGKLQ